MENIVQTTTSEAFAAAWTTKERANGDTFWILRKDSPELFTDAVHAAHDALDAGLPCDWIYEACAHLSEHLEDDEDRDHETCDGLVEVYTSKLYGWAADYGWTRVLIDAAAEEFGTSESHEKQIMAAQYLAYTQILASLRSSLDI